MKLFERIIVVHWEGPYQWEECTNHKEDGHVLYAMHGAHHLYGRDVLLYIGRSGVSAANRIKDHEGWVADEYDAMTVRFASIGELADSDWTDWDDGERYPKAAPDLVAKVEALLIYAHQPAYNVMSKGSIEIARGLRIMNTGRLGHLLPEVSYLYQVGD